ncbi:MAG: glycosyltransferase family 39 protein [Rhizobacter sp.]|nr:glycosyltransferase family 39 protein [Chlorobiales bacterium]
MYRLSKWLPAAIILLYSVIALYDLGGLELQPWDESYYALRAKAILRFGCWLDQTDYAVSGFYSASHPPLQIWWMALTATLFGLTEASLRIWSWLSFAGMLTVLYGISRRTTFNIEASRSIAMLVVICAGGAPLAVWYARIAQLDMMVLLFSSLQILTYLNYLHTRRKAYLILLGAALALALLTKSLVGLFPAMAILSHQVYLLWRRETHVAAILKVNSLWLLIGMLGFSWLAVVCWITPEHLKYYTDHYLINRFGRNLMPNGSRTGYFYYLNLIITRFPVALICIAWFWKFFKDAAFRTNERVLSVLWLMITFVIMSLSQTKLMFYGLLLWPPLMLISGESLWIVGSSFGKQRSESSRPTGVAIASLVLLGAAVMWSAAAGWHREVSDLVLHLGSGSMEQWFKFAVIAGSIPIGYAGAKVLLRFESARWILPGLVAAVSIGAAMNTIANGLTNVPTIYSTGIRSVKATCDSLQPSHIIYLVAEKRLSQPSINPQFSYYFDGLDLHSSRWPRRSAFTLLPVEKLNDSLYQILSVAPDAVFILDQIGSAADTSIDESLSESGVVRALKAGDYTVYQARATGR